MSPFIPTPPFFVYGFTDRFTGNGFPACDGPIPTIEEASRVLRALPERGFHFRNSRGFYGWITERESGRTVEPAGAE